MEVVLNTATFYIESGPLGRPGADRGLGRYTRALISAYEDLDVSAIPVSGPNRMAISMAIERSGSRENSVYHGTSPYGMPLLKYVRWICSIQDTIPLDLKDYSRLGIKSRILYRNAARSNCILTNSTYTKGRVCERFGISPERVHAIPLPINPIFYADSGLRSTTDANYITGLVDLRTPDPRKRPHWLAPIARRLKSAGIPLRVAGRGLERLSLVVPDAVPVVTSTDEDLRDFLAGGKAHIYTSAYEGQGLPPIEAMAAGSPVIAFNNTSIGEMIGNSQFLLEDPVPWTEDDLGAPLPDSVADNIVDICVSLCADFNFRDQYTAAARDRAAIFTRQNFTSQLRAVLNDVIA